jgi:hypothetical protein
MRAGELQHMRRVTKMFIAANTYPVTLTPAAYVRTGSGGKVRSNGPSRDEQMMRLIDQSGSTGSVPGPVRGEDGVNRTVTHMLLGAHDAEMEVGDRWTGADGLVYEIVEMFPDNGYERRARVSRYG